jgi:tRNA A-37 threonylcarbamoyl transferase component Bud32
MTRPTIEHRTGLWHPRTVAVHPAHTELTDFVASLPERMEREEGVCIHRGRNILRLLDYDGQQYVVKAFHRPHLINRFVYGVLRPSKAKRSHEMARRLTEQGIGTPEPIGYCNVRGWLGITFHRSYYVSQRSVCTHRYEDLFTHDFPYAEEVLRAIGRLTAQLHELQWMHKDYGRANILFERLDDGTIRLELVDLNRMVACRKPVGMVDGCRNFERLPATPQMHRWMAEAYAEARGFDSDTCFRMMQQFRATQGGKIDGKY